MNLSLEWLAEYLDLTGVSAVELAEQMSRTGIEIESIHNYGDSLDQLKVGLVLDCQPHPDSDHLKITQVDVGQSKPLQIVCGAPNIGQGQKVIVAVPGAKLPGGIKIQSTELRGVASQGMICSLQELGFADSVVPKKYAQGIYLLPEEAEVGQDIVELFALDDPILELDLTPNRADALSMHGLIYEVAAILKQDVNLSAMQQGLPETEEKPLQETVIKLADSNLAPIFSLRHISDVTVKESPLKIQIRLMKMGIRPLNNIVDLTNYVMLLLGQPLHAYDYEKLPGKDITVRLAKPDEQLKTLDGEARQLTDQDIVISSNNQAIGLAGVMGGFDTEVTESTREILLESAMFMATPIRRTANKYHLRSQASLRNEKGLDPNRVLVASQLAGQLIGQYAEANPVQSVSQLEHIDQTEHQVTIPYQDIIRKIGIDLSREALKEIFDRLHFEVSYGEADFTVRIPSRRGDLHIDADIFEEIARIYGYDRIPSRLPASKGQPGALTTNQKFNRRSQDILEGFGLNQVISYILTSEDKAKLYQPVAQPLVHLALPMSSDRTTLRQSMFPALLEVTQYNLARQAKDIAIYEMGRVFIHQGRHQQPLEQERLAIMVSGQEQAKTWYGSENTYDFYVLKGMVETYFAQFNLLERIEFVPSDQIPVMHPGQTASILLDGQGIGFMGRVHPNICDQYDLAKATYFMEVDLEAIQKTERTMKKTLALAKYPASTRDIAMVLPQNVQHGRIVKLLESHGGSYLKEVELFDQYIGEQIDADKQSLAYHLTFQNPEATIRDEEINLAMDKIYQALVTIDGLEIR
ncbi:phenylalanine--tRNA ligase subunit beta [Ignavigranum ruoffiae]|uniref:phenylalanine--tRNA ligase subunit beta n=1 Tax=Ignavigranum ruoffiae TaxID=89093 RepID=UPI00206546E7|nr:phenylalanine--tRNA ligase subunit beta [Ignavigranum ruoffiae]UPQ85722.1 phenylalanine--tRNA ligase subunit beta [Ignavigranum ruoffiae]